MPTRTEMVVTVAEKAVNSSSAADTLITAHNERQENFVLVNSIGQVLASVVSLAKILAPVTMQFNTFAGAVTFLKIVVDINNTGDFQTGDVLTLVGNVAGFVATVTVLAGAAPVWTTVASAVAISATGAAIYNGTNFSKLAAWTNNMVDTYWPTAPIPTTTDDIHLDSNGNWRSYDEITSDPNGAFGAIRMTASNWGSGGSIIPIPPPDREPPIDDDRDPRRITLSV